MKKYIMIIMCALFLSACVPTPEEEVVAHKDAEEMEEALRKTEESVTGDDQQDTVFHYEDSYQGGDINVQIQIDADMTVPAEGVSVLRMVPHTITADDMKRLAAVLFEGNEPYDVRTELTKKEIEQSILILKKTLTNIESEYLRGERDKEDYLEVKADFEQQIARMEADYVTAPEVIEKKPATYTFDITEYPDKNGREFSMKVCAEIEGEEVYLKAKNFAGDYHEHSIFYNATNLAAKPGELKDTEEEAIAITENFLEKAELTDWKFYKITKVEKGPENDSYFNVRYIRTCNGVDIEPLPQPEVIGSEYQFQIGYEEMEIHISNGRVVYLWYRQPMDIVEVVNEKAALLPFDKTTERIKTLLQSIYTANNKLLFGDRRLLIDDIQLGYARVQIPDKEAEFYLAPAWFLYSKHSSWMSEYYADKYGEIVMTPFLVMNAVDGTRIDTSVGY